MPGRGHGCDRGTPDLADVSTIARAETSVARESCSSTDTDVSDPADIAEAVARGSYGRLLAFIAARTGDVAGAEDALSEAFAAALADWPVHGVPANPQAWLLTAARRKLIDAVRRDRTSREAGDHLRLLADELADQSPPDIPDNRLALLFVCAHRAIDPSVRAPLMLQTVLGLDAATIASAFLTAPATMGQRLVRAKARIKQAAIPFRLPDRADLPERLDPVLDAIYAAFTAGWTDPGGTDWRRRNLAREAIWLCRLVVALLPDAPEALGLLALMLYAESRHAARRTADGDYIPLDEQDVDDWDGRLIEEAEALLLRASRDGRDRAVPIGSGGAVRACRAAANRPDRLGRDCAAV